MQDQRVDRTASDQKIDTIREILVGDEINALNTRFYKLRKNVEAHCSKLSSELTTKFEDLQSLTKSEADELRSSVTRKVNEIQEESAGLSEEVQNGMQRVAGLEKRMEEMKTILSEQIRKMHQDFYKQMSEFSRLVKSRQEEVARQAISRKEFAKILHGLAGNLTPEPSEPASAGSEKEE